MKVDLKEEQEVKRRDNLRRDYLAELEAKELLFSILIAFAAGLFVVIKIGVWFQVNFGLFTECDFTQIIFGVLLTGFLGFGVGSCVYLVILFILSLFNEAKVVAKYPRTYYEIQKSKNQRELEKERKQQEAESELRFRELNRPDWATMNRCDELLNLLNHFDPCSPMMLDPMINAYKNKIKTSRNYDRRGAILYCEQLEELLLTSYIDTLICHPAGYRWVMAHKR